MALDHNLYHNFKVALYNKNGSKTHLRKNVDKDLEVEFNRLRTRSVAGHCKVKAPWLYLMTLYMFLWL